MEDKRFAHIASDPKFRRIPRGEKKVKIDSRFKSMFKDKKFKVTYTIDSRGRPVNRTSTEDLKRYYHLSSSDEDSSEEETEELNKAEEASEPGKFVRAPTRSNDETHDLDLNENDAEVSEDVKTKLKNLQVDYARGESKLFSASSSDDESESEQSETDSIEHNWGELDADAERNDEVTHRLAACNMDWDRIRAIDLMVLFNSFMPQGGVIKSVAIYPSEFGKQRMKEEEEKGPTELVEDKHQDLEENDDEKEEGAKYHMEKLRKYQLNRLKYYYAVINCDSARTANKIYAECDGMEYESSATKIDLRFIPDDMIFENDPKEICDNVPESSKYQPRFFTTSALQQAKVNLTWDETNPDRIELTQKLASGKLDGIDENDLQEYLASSSGEEDEKNDEDEASAESENEGETPIDKYRALLAEIENKEKEKEQKGVEMEISWGIDLQKKTEKIVKQRQSEKEEKTPFQKYLDKRKEKRKEKRDEKKKHLDENVEVDDDIPSDVDMSDKYFAEEFDKAEFKKNPKSKQKEESKDIDPQASAELELLLMGDDDGKKHFNMKTIEERENESKTKKKQKKKKKETVEEEKKDDEFEINVADERFSALYTSHHFNIDPTDSHFKKTKGMEKIISEKLKRRDEDVEADNPDLIKRPKKDAELSMLVKSVKRKTQAFANKRS